VTAHYILAAFATAFLIAAIMRVTRDGGTVHPQSRAWLLIAVIFGVVSVWLGWRG
jgi:hypothetical protein